MSSSPSNSCHVLYLIHCFHPRDQRTWLRSCLARWNRGPGNFELPTPSMSREQIRISRERNAGNLEIWTLRKCISFSPILYLKCFRPGHCSRAGLADAAGLDRRRRQEDESKVLEAQRSIEAQRSSKPHPTPHVYPNLMGDMPVSVRKCCFINKLFESSRAKL